MPALIQEHHHSSDRFPKPGTNVTDSLTTILAVSEELSAAGEKAQLGLSPRPGSQEETTTGKGEKTMTRPALYYECDLRFCFGRDGGTCLWANARSERRRCGFNRLGFESS